MLLGTSAHLPGMSTAYPHKTALFGLEPMLTTAELSTVLGIPVSTIYDWRTHGKGPVAHRFGKHLRFAMSDVQTWMATRRGDKRMAGRELQ